MVRQSVLYPMEYLIGGCEILVVSILRMAEVQEQSIFYLMEGHVEGSYILTVKVIRKVQRRSGTNYFL